MGDEAKEILKQVHRRLLNLESSVRMFEQRVSTVEKLMKASEEKISKNTQQINELKRTISTLGSELEGDHLKGMESKLDEMEASLKGLTADLKGKAGKNAVDQLMKYLHLIDPVNHVTKEEVEEIIRTMSGE